MSRTLSGSRSRRLAATAAVAVATVGFAASSASAAPTGDYAVFSQCPTNVEDLASCVVSDTTSGSIKLGSTTVPINKRIRLQGGYSYDPVTYEERWHNAKNGQTLERTALNVPGGLLGITIPSQVPQPIRGLLEAGINTVNGVKATAELVGPVQFSFANFANAEGPAAVLPLRVKLDNPFLGDNCYIGSASAPVTLRLTAGTTTPPAGTAPITGSPGTLEFLNEANLIRSSGVSLVDNGFAAPKAKGCGGIFSWAIDPVVNLKVGLPSPAGNNVARFNGTAQIGAATAVRESDPSD
jgi:hypothetical protein